MSDTVALGPRGVTRLVHAAAAHTAIFHYTRWPAYLGTTRRLAAALGLADGERLLDVGCGTGIFAGLARGAYVGLDTSLPSLAFGRRRSRQRGHAFVAMSVAYLGLAAGSADRALVINVAHHLDDGALDALLLDLRRVVTKRVLLVDLDPDDANALERWFIRHDRGSFPRSRAALRRLVGRHWTVEREDVFHNALHTQPQVLFSLAPPR